ncbi:hypothetical protein L210DRAFT_3508656 [Boletus edulis BED1]|uniref:Uncharacterized protein n=1 Tax=Boletus edulis BED1 TaxID=1328754 RepID=A0AAD4G7Y0_BOLED|nr:hypothetical protein L210DRAFT_3508656 [Boletus edulis BED1]
MTDSVAVVTHTAVKPNIQTVMKLKLYSRTNFCNFLSVTSVMSQSRRESQVSRARESHQSVTLRIALLDLAHVVLLSAEYILSKPVRAKPEKAVGLVGLHAALEGHAPVVVVVLHAVAPEEVSDDPVVVSVIPAAVVPLAAPEEVFDDVRPLSAMPLAAPEEFFADVTPLSAMPPAAPEESFDVVTPLSATSLVAPEEVFADVTVLSTMPLVLSQQSFDDEALVVAMLPAEAQKAFAAPFPPLAIVHAAIAFGDDAVAVAVAAVAVVAVAILENGNVPVLAELADISGEHCNPPEHPFEEDSEAVEEGVVQMVDRVVEEGMVALEGVGETLCPYTCVAYHDVLFDGEDNDGMEGNQADVDHVQPGEQHVGHVGEKWGEWT